MFGLQLAAWVGLFVATCLGACFQGSVGFGLSFTIVPFLVVLEPSAIPTVPVLVVLPIVIATVSRDFAHVDLRGSGWLIVGRLPGTVVGAVLLTFISAKAMGLAVGILLLASVAAIVARFRPRLSRETQLAAGFASGVMGTAAGLGGPPISLVYRGESGATMRSTANLAILAGTVMTFSAVLATDRWDPAHALLAVSLMPASFIGFLISRFANRHLSVIGLQRAVLVFATTAALGAIAQALL
jgi:uncharacterized membrane protein YfcA